MVSGLRTQPQVRVVGDDEVDQARVAVVVTDEVDRECVRVLRAMQRGGVPRTVVVARTLDDAAVVAAAEAGVPGLLRRADATPERLAEVVSRHAGAPLRVDLPLTAC